MEELLERLVVAVENQNNAIPWDSIISVLALIASWVAIIILLIERREKKRPYLHITFELVRSSLACIVIRNIGTVPLTIHSIQFNELFVCQLPEKARQRFIDLNETDICIYPNKQWVISLDLNVFDIIKEFKQKELRCKYTYTEINKEKQYSEDSYISFENYAGMLNYISETDELRREIENLGKTLNSINKSLSDINVGEKE